MGLEIEHKFLLKSAAWRAQVVRSEVFRQGYLSNDPRASVRVRMAGAQAHLNIKGMTVGLQRPEYEYPIPVQDAEELLATLCGQPVIDKVRHFVEFAGKTWEIDEFKGDNNGLIVAEIELSRIDEAFERPDWAGADVSGLQRYYNVSLLTYPYSQWTDAEKACA